jgi:hypothetical protein
VAGDEDDGQLNGRLGEIGLEVEPAGARQTHIEDETAGNVGNPAAQELGRRAERRDAQSHRCEELHQGLAHGRVVVDHEDQGLRVGGVGHHGSWGWQAGSMT